MGLGHYARHLSGGLALQGHQETAGVCGNGLELWRQMYHEFKGTGAMTKNLGRRRLHNFGRCNDLAKLSQHLDEWQNQLDEFGAELLQCPEQLRSMIDEVIPEAIETELLDHDDVITYSDVIGFCNKRTYHLKQKTLARAASREKVNALTKDKAATDVPVPGGDEASLEPPAWFKPFIAALSSPPAPHSAVRPAKGDSRGRPEKRDRSTSRGSRGSSNGSNRDSSLYRLRRKFIFKGGCKHCGKDGPKKQDCAEFLALKKKNNGELPKGYKGAREVAFDKWDRRVQKEEERPKGQGQRQGQG